MKNKLLMWGLLTQMMVKTALASTQAFTEIADNQSLTFFQTTWTSIMPAGYYLVPLLIMLGGFFILMWSKQPFEGPAIMLMIFLGGFSFLLIEGGFELGAWVFRGVAIAAGMIILIKLFWRD